MRRFLRLSVMLLSPYTTQLAGLTGRTIRVGLERLELNVVGMESLVQMGTQYTLSFRVILSPEVFLLRWVI
jgi:hypothetical protein